MNIFIHYLDKELLEIYSSKKFSEDIIRKVTFSIKVALLLLEEDECLYIPAPNYFESDLSQIVLENFRINRANAVFANNEKFIGMGKSKYKD